YIFGFDRLLQYPLDPFIPHLNDFSDWLVRFWGIPLIIVVMMGVILAVKKRNLVIAAILLWSLLPLGAELALLKTFTARYLLFCIPPLLLVGAWGLSQISWLKSAVGVV